MSLLVQIAAQFTGKKAFKDANKSVNLLESSAKKLGSTLGLSLSTAAVVAFGKASAKAFMEDEKQAAKLANTVNNLGIGFANPAIATYIDQLQKLTGVADSELRPALQALLQQTGSLAKSQELLNLAISVSRGSGEALTTVTNDLAQAYVGNNRGLRKYYLGLSQTELKTASFVDLQARLNKQFSGANAAYLNTYAGQMQLLSTAAGEAQETIGKGLIDSVALLGKDKSVEDLAQSMQDLADFTSNTVYGMASLVSQLQKVGGATPSWLKSLIGNTVGRTPLAGVLDSVKALSAYGAKQQNTKLENASVQMFKTDMANFRLGKEKIKVDKKQIAAQKALTAEQKKQAALKKAQGIFDLDKAQIIAALQGDISKQEKLRLELQMALLEGNSELATKLSAELAMSQLKTENLALRIKDLPAAYSPFGQFIKDIDTVIAKLAQIQLNNIFTAAGGSTARGQEFTSLTPTVQSLVSGAVTGSAGSTAAGDVYISVQGSVLSEQDLVNAVQNGLNYNALAGKRSDIGRIAGMFG